MGSYVKVVNSDTIRGLQGGMNSATSFAVPALHTFQNNCCVILAPSRYSNVRKVVFSLATGKLGNGTTSTCQLLLRIASTTASPTLTAQKFNLAFSTLVEGTPDFGFVPTNFVDPGINGPTTTIDQTVVTAGERDLVQLLTVEFDREDSNADAFFAAWDSFDDDDDMMMITPAIDSLTADTGAAIGYRFKNFQAAIVQEDDFTNDTSTDWHGYIGCRDVLENTVAFQGDTTGPRMPFHYVAADWNGIDSVSIVFYGSEPSNATQLTVRLRNLTDASTVFDEVFSLPAAGVEYYVCRTQNFISDLEDGKVYYIDYLLDAANSTSDPKGTGYFSIVQRNFTRTATLHQLTGTDFIPTTTDENSTVAILFDPSWYAGTSPRERKMVSSFIQNAAANNPIQRLRIDTNLTSDDHLRGSGTAKDLTPEHTHTGGPIQSYQQFTDILTNDPLDESVPVRIGKSFPTAVWTSAPGDFPGHMGVYYAYTVPRAAEVLSQFGSGDPAFDTDIGPI